MDILNQTTHEDTLDRYTAKETNQFDTSTIVVKKQAITKKFYHTQNLIIKAYKTNL